MLFLSIFLTICLVKAYVLLSSFNILEIDLSNKTKDEGKELGSPSRFGSCRDTSIVEEVFSSPARRSRLDLSLSPSKASRASPVRKFALDDNDGEKGKKRWVTWAERPNGPKVPSRKTKHYKKYDKVWKKQYIGKFKGN